MQAKFDPTVVYEDNHLLIVSKRVGEIVQGDKTGDEPLVESLKHWLKEKYAKPGNVFLGLVNRLDRPVSGLVIFAKTSKALSRMNAMLQKGEIQKTYWAIVCGCPMPEEQDLSHYLLRNEKQNKSYAYEREQARSKLAKLSYRLLKRGDRYSLLEVQLHTGRHHQIRCQLAHVGVPIKGDLKYGAKRSNPNGGICLHARYLSFVHPVKKELIELEAPLPNESLWQMFM